MCTLLFILSIILLFVLYDVIINDGNIPTWIGLFIFDTVIVSCLFVILLATMLVNVTVFVSVMDSVQVDDKLLLHEYMLVLFCILKYNDGNMIIRLYPYFIPCYNYIVII